MVGVPVPRWPDDAELFLLVDPLDQPVRASPGAGLLRGIRARAAGGGRDGSGGSGVAGAAAPRGPSRCGGECPVDPAVGECAGGGAGAGRLADRGGGGVHVAGHRSAGSPGGAGTDAGGRGLSAAAGRKCGPAARGSAVSGGVSSGPVHAGLGHRRRRARPGADPPEDLAK